jgi:hypothetical protein
LAEAQSEPLLKITHLLTNGRAANAQAAFCGREPTRFDYASKDSQQADIEVADLRQRIGTACAHCLVVHELKIIKAGF